MVSSSISTKTAMFMMFKFNSIFILLSFLVPSLILCQPTHLLTSCFTLHNINNFTLFPHTHNESSVYYKLLNFSIQNLRFADPLLPKPFAIVLPETMEQLVNSVSCLRKGLWEIRVRSGGHSYEGTSSIATNGVPFVIIDMMNLNQVVVDLKSETAWVEGGATLGETYYAISESSNIHGFSAGSCPTVGIGGHVSGGGFGILSRKYGLAADNVVDALLIDADGRLLDRKAMGEDVFWAIRGGGGGVWGIVYAWKISLLKVPQIVTAFIVSRPGTKSHVAKLVHKWQYVAPKLEDDFYISAIVGAGLPHAKTVGISATFYGFYLGQRSKAMSILNQNFPELGIVEEDCIEMSWIESVVYLSTLNPGSSTLDLKTRYLRDKNNFKGKSDYVRTPISIGGVKKALHILEKEPKGYVVLDPYGGMMENISNEAIAFPHRKGILYGIHYLVEWKEEDDMKSDEYIEWIRGFHNSMTPYVSKAPRAAYINYMDLDLGVMKLVNNTACDAVEMARVWGEKYFLKNYDRLVRAKTMIDPNNVFKNQQGIPPMSSVSVKD